MLEVTVWRAGSTNAGCCPAAEGSGIDQEGAKNAGDQPAVLLKPGDGGRCCFPLLQRGQSPFHVAFVDARLPNAVNPR
jgi:hypothetical protein